MQAFLKESRTQIADLCRAHHVRRLAVFGSAVRDDFDPERSDVDLLVEFEPIGFDRYFDNKAELRKRLAEIFARKIDLLTYSSIRNPYLRREIEADNELLYAA